MLHQRDYFIGPRDRVVEASVVAIGAQKQPHRCERGALVSLLECVGARDACHQSDRKRDNVLFTEAEEIARTRQCIFKKAKIANEMPLASFCELKSIVLDDDFYRQPMRLIRQGRLGSSDIWRYARDLARRSRFRP